jgi:hypothetical protein
MASQNDWDTRKMRLDAQVLGLNDLVNTFVNKTKATDELMKEVDTIHESIGEQENRIDSADEAAATYDREFLDRKADMPGKFVKDKLYTIQDFTLFLFMISYILFALAVALISGKNITVLGIMAGIGILIFASILRYA